MVVLIVDDNLMKIGPIADRLATQYPMVKVLKATTLPQAYEMLKTERPHCIVLDGCMQSNKLDTLPFIEHVRQLSESLPLIANSSDSYYCRKMVEAGCTCQAAEDHLAIVEQIVGLAERFIAAEV